MLSTPCNINARAPDDTHRFNLWLTAAYLVDTDPQGQLLKNMRRAATSRRSWPCGGVAKIPTMLQIKIGTPSSWLHQHSTCNSKLPEQYLSPCAETRPYQPASQPQKAKPRSKARGGAREGRRESQPAKASEAKRQAKPHRNPASKPRTQKPARAKPKKRDQESTRGYGSLERCSRCLRLKMLWLT